MAEPVRLYDLGLHVGMRVLTGVFGAIGVWITSANLQAGERHPIFFVIMGFFALVILILFRTIWQTKAVVADTEGRNLLVGRGPKRRQIAIADLVSVGRPWWAFGDRIGSPLEVEARGGHTFIFFPEIGADDYIAARGGPRRRD